MSFLDTDSDLGGNTSDDSSDSSQSRDLPDYETFLGRLQYVDTNTIASDEECPICRIPYTTSLAERRHEEGEYLNHERFQCFETLPFHHSTPHDDIDRPVRLPCAAGHIVGRACLINWATQGSGTACPLDREVLFQRRRRTPLPRYVNDTVRFDRGVRSINRMPIRDLLRRFRNVTGHDTIRVDARAMVEGLSPLILRVIYHRAGFRESHPTIRWPSISDAATLLTWQQAPQFRRFVRRFVRDEPLMRNGLYPGYIRDLLNPVLPHVFSLLYRLAEQYHAETIGAYELARSLRYRVRRFFGDFSDLIAEERMMIPVAMLTIDLWVTQSLLLTELGRETDQPFYRHARVGEATTTSEDHRAGRPYPGHPILEAQVGYVDGPGWDRRGGYSRLPTLSAASSTWHVVAHLQPPRSVVLADSGRERSSRDDSGSEVVHVPDHVFAALWESTRGPAGLDGPSREGASLSDDTEDVVSRVIVPQRALEMPVLEAGSTASTPENTTEVQRERLRRELPLSDRRGFVLGEELEGREGPVVRDDGSVMIPGTPGDGPLEAERRQG